MKLTDLSKKAINYLKDAGDKGINNIELAESLQMPRRRVYDVIAILKAAGLVESRREKGGTRVLWACTPAAESVNVSSNGTKELDKLKSENSKLIDENESLKEKIKRIREDTSKEEPKRTSEKKVFDTAGIIVRAAKSLKINEVVSSGIQLVIKASGKGIIIEPISEDEK
ncbi:MAG: E2F family transcription factor [Candidatus Helarchaeota archaeon]|nr:E2F family transcription factor [Candidatus Helarchaeota archaeon]